VVRTGFIGNIRLIVTPLIMIPKPLIQYKTDLKVVGVAFLFYASAYLGYALTFHATTQISTWPPSGIAFALIILLGRSAWPGITIGSLLANVMGYWNDGALGVQSVILLSGMIAIANTTEALVGNYLIKRWIKTDYPFTTTKNTFRFLFVSIFMCSIGAAIATSSLLVNGVIINSQIMGMLLTWLVSNVTGVLLFTPFILAFNYFAKIRLNKESLIQLGVLIAIAVGLTLFLKIDYTNTTLARAVPFLLIPVLLWLAFRFELAIAMSFVLLIALSSIYISIKGFGPFMLDDPAQSIILLQVFITVISVSTIVLSATVRERRIAEKKLQEFNGTLEAKVQERTKALHDEIFTRKEAEEKLQRTNQELSKRNTELDNFVYSVSHDLRAPIASVLGLINLAKKDGNVAMKDVYLDMIHKSANQQDHFIREILDQSRNSRLDIKREEIFFEPIIEETFNQLKFATATGQNVERIITVTQDQPFYSDKWRLKVILNNIISNSIRYRNGKDPIIKVNVAVNPQGALVEIEDNGKGIGKEHLNKVCNMFYRATDDGAGSGLGLYIVKETIDKLNGSLKIDSEIGRGTMVSMSIPLLDTTPKSPKGDLNAPLSEEALLVVN
jgi:integral membrane sensor domain MASE1/nitrogen-specific signal transduction histidine kinase